MSFIRNKGCACGLFSASQKLGSFHVFWEPKSGSVEKHAEIFFTQHEAAFEDAGDWEGHEEPEEDEHDVVDGEGGSNAGHDLDHRSHQHRPSSTEPVEMKKVH